MSRILALGADFIERMANPAYGIRVNEEYALRFAALLSDERLERTDRTTDDVSDSFEELLSTEIARLRAPDTLSAHGWLWILNWARAKRVRLNDELLQRLAENWSSTFMQVSVIAAATDDVEWRRRETVDQLAEFEHPWLRELLRRCVGAGRDQVGRDEHVDTGRSETLLVALMQTGNDVALDAASVLLNHPWAGQSKLVAHFDSLCRVMDKETRDLWRSRLRLPPELPNRDRQ